MNRRAASTRELIWLDTLSRPLLESGEFAALMRDYAVTGATSNPTIFAKAITGSDRYDEQLRAVVDSGILDRQAVFFELALEDIRSAAAMLRPAYEASSARTGSCRSSARPTSPTTPRARSRRRSSCGIALTSPT